MEKHSLLTHPAWHWGWCRWGTIDVPASAYHTTTIPNTPEHNPDDDRFRIEVVDPKDAKENLFKKQARPALLVWPSSVRTILPR
jgi:hypothetical protein